MKILMLEDIMFMKFCEKQLTFVAETGHFLLLMKFSKEESTVWEDNKDMMDLMMDIHNKLDVIFNKVDVVANKLGMVVDMDMVREFNNHNQVDTSWIWDTECKTDVASDFLLFLDVSGLKKHTNSQMQIDFFQLYLTDELFQLLVTETNWYASQFIAEREGNNGSDDSYAGTSEDTTIAEMKRFTELLILMGIVYKPTIPMYWSTRELHNRPIFSKVMPRTCFQLLLKFLHFNNNDLHDLKYEIEIGCTNSNCSLTYLESNVKKYMNQGKILAFTSFLFYSKDKWHSTNT